MPAVRPGRRAALGAGAASTALLAALVATTALTAHGRTVPATVARAGTPSCLATASGQVCLDGFHTAHLRTAAMRVGDCVDLTYTGRRPAAATLTRVLPVPCPAVRR